VSFSQTGTRSRNGPRRIAAARAVPLFLDH
jgi:hypothetical protein